MKLINKNLTDETEYNLNEITKIENYVNKQIKQRKSWSKKLRKYSATFDYIIKFLIVLSAKVVGFVLILL